VDAGEPNVNEFTESLKNALKALGDVRIGSIVCTHWHHDHVGGVNGSRMILPCQPCIVSFLDVIKKIVGHDIPVHKLKRTDKDDQYSPDGGYSYIEDGHVFRTDGATLR
jgi:ribonuclease/clavin/mitogillin